MSEVLERPETTGKKRESILGEARLGLAEQMRQDWVVNVEEGTTVEDIQRPDYWSHVAVRMQQFDRIECRWETGERIAELIVVGCGRNWLQVHLAKLHDLEKRGDTPAVALKHTVEWKGPQRKHVVIRISDQQAVQEGFPTKAEAQLWLANHERVTG